MAISGEALRFPPDRATPLRGGSLIVYIPIKTALPNREGRYFSQLFFRLPV